MSAHVYPSVFWIISCIHVKNIINISPTISWKFLTMDEINVNFLTALKKQREGNMDTCSFSMCLFRDCVYYFPFLYVPLWRAFKDHNTGTSPLSLWTLVLSLFWIFSLCGRKNEKTYKVNPTYQRSLQRLLVHGWVVYHFIQFIFFHSSSYFILCPFLLWGYAKLFCWVIW